VMEISGKLKPESCFLTGWLKYSRQEATKSNLSILIKNFDKMKGSAAV